MGDLRRVIHALFLIALPIIVAWYGISVAGAIALVVLTLLWRWAIVVSLLLSPPKYPELVLETINASHFAEKARWCLDKLGVSYTERHVAGIFGVLFQGRTVPQLTIKTGIVRSVIGNSPEILRFLWGRYGYELKEHAAFLEPSPERVEMESRIDRYGAHLQVWVYYHILDHREVALRAWGIKSSKVPAWQRVLLPVLYPVLAAFIRKVFRISDDHYTKVVQKIEDLLEDVEGRLDDGRRSILNSDDTDYVDITFAAISGLWLQPENYAGANAAVARIPRESYPIQMGVDVERWCDRFPLAVALIDRLYREERLSA